MCQTKVTVLRPSEGYTANNSCSVLLLDSIGKSLFSVIVGFSSTSIINMSKKTVHISFWDEQNDDTLISMYGEQVISGSFLYCKVCIPVHPVQSAASFLWTYWSCLSDPHIRIQYTECVLSPFH